ncbi:hypothetical protein [Daejeonella sp.]|uniref:hypothetical protein n=1 Tax=Daejeonella sp. TaxID=2805397 RepID=UPI00273207BC|nr:hypothetical protein [Daejeonella sp.]MDP2412446.1 hypothetical protein [Daejeonella sp.]
MGTKDQHDNGTIIKRKVLMNIRKYISLTFLFTFLIFLTSCKDSINDSQAGDNVTVSLAMDKGLNKIGSDPIVLDTVKILLKDIKFRQSNGDSSNVKVGPMVAHLNLNGIPTEFAAGKILAGNYDKIKFRLHKPEAGDIISDPEFIAGSSGELRYSVIVKGTYNGVPFIYKSTKTATQEVNLKNYVNLNAEVKTNVTLSVDVNFWFYKDAVVLDPNNIINQNDIDNNIKDSFKKAFRDANKDGIAD